MFNLIHEIVRILKKQKIKVHDEIDGRTGSVKDEEEVLKPIRTIVNSSEFFKHIDLIEPEVRSWFDFALKYNGRLFPYNIKSSTLKTADNLSCKLGLFYTLTGIDPDSFEKSIVPWKEYNIQLAKNLNGLKSEVDYGFLVINKLDTSDIFYTSLRSIRTLTPNGNNLPFQCTWENNRELSPKKYKIEELKYLIETYHKALVKSIGAVRGFENLVLPVYQKIIEESKC